MTRIDARLLFALAALVIGLCAGPAHAQTGSSKGTSALNTEVNIFWPDNTVGAITPYNARQTLLDIIASYFNSNTSGAITGSNIAANTIANGNLVANTVSNASLAQMAASTIKGNNTGSTANAADLSAGQTQVLLGQGRILFRVRGVNFNSANTDNAITITLPPGSSNYHIGSLQIANASASLSTSTWGLFSATGGGGTAIFGAGQANTITSASANTNNNAMGVAPANVNTESFNFTTLYFRIGTAQGSAATADVTLEILPL